MHSTRREIMSMWPVRKDTDNERRAKNALLSSNLKESWGQRLHIATTSQFHRKRQKPNLCARSKAMESVKEPQLTLSIADLDAGIGSSRLFPWHFCTIYPRTVRVHGKHVECSEGT